MSRRPPSGPPVRPRAGPSGTLPVEPPPRIERMTPGDKALVKGGVTRVIKLRLHLSRRIQPLHSRGLGALGPSDQFTLEALSS